jgi:hypothetical protein
MTGQDAIVLLREHVEMPGEMKLRLRGVLIDRLR